MNILGTQYTLNNKAFEIYISGCKGNPHCKGCHNPESWDFNAGEKIDIEKETDLWISKILYFGSIIKNIMIFGGEPLDQEPYELEVLLKKLSLLNIPIWIFTRYRISEVPDFVKKYCSYIKCGRYIESMKCEDNIQYGIKLATLNQFIYKKGVDF